MNNAIDSVLSDYTNNFLFIRDLKKCPSTNQYYTVDQRNVGNLCDIIVCSESVPCGYLESVHRLVESSEVAVVLGGLDVVLSKRLVGEFEGGDVQGVGLLQEQLLRLLVVAVYGNLLEDQGWTQAHTGTYRRWLFMAISSRIRAEHRRIQAHTGAGCLWQSTLGSGLNTGAYRHIQALAVYDNLLQDQG